MLLYMRFKTRNRKHTRAQRLKLYYYIYSLRDDTEVRVMSLYITLDSEGRLEVGKNDYNFEGGYIYWQAIYKLKHFFHYFHLRYKRFWVVLRRLSRLYNRSKKAASRGSYTLRGSYAGGTSTQAYKQNDRLIRSFVREGVLEFAL